jgi:hypothetical protein
MPPVIPLGFSEESALPLSLALQGMFITPIWQFLPFANRSFSPFFPSQTRRSAQHDDGGCM